MIISFMLMKKSAMDGTRSRYVTKIFACVHVINTSTLINLQSTHKNIGCALYSIKNFTNVDETLRVLSRKGYPTATKSDIQEMI